jgi:hypothetical protein
MTRVHFRWLYADAEAPLFPWNPANSVAASFSATFFNFSETLYI